MDYNKFLLSKQTVDAPSGFDVDDCQLPENLFDFQKSIVRWALKRGRAAIFADTGMGKTAMQLSWANAVHQHTGNRVLIVAPLCVAYQTVDESNKFDIRLPKFYREMNYEDTGIFVTNYEMLDKFEEAIKGNYFDGIVLDESSILKHEDSKYRNKIISLSKNIPYRLSCTATPSPNDHMELASQSEFLGIMDAAEMLAMFFTHDSGETSKWRLKGHAQDKFWEWMASWAVYIKKPSDIGFSDDNYILPELNIEFIKLDTGLNDSDYRDKKGMGLKGRNKARKDTTQMRCEKAAELANSIEGSVAVWCHLNDESQLLTSLINGAVEVKGSDKITVKEDRLMGFSSGKNRAIVTKPKIAGFGMNWQHCNNTIFVGLNDSYEQLYQAIRRFYRFGQKNKVNVYLISSDIEGDIVENIKNKERKTQEMQENIVKYMRDFQTRNVKSLEKQKSEYIRESYKKDNFEVHLADCVDLSSELTPESIDYSIFSPPFSSLYTYSNSERDMGNSKGDDEFWAHFSFMVKNLYTALRSGRNVSVHCMNLPTSKSRHGYIGIRDFRGDVIRLFQSHGFIYHSEVTVWKNPVVAMQRTKALGLLWKQIKKDSSMNRQGIPDYVITFRKPGENTKPISHTPDDFTVDEWQQIASPCWMDINQSNTLNYKMARDNQDERHIAPLQLGLIERCMRLWSSPGDLVFSPFTGIGSEGHVALRMGRRFIGSELKKSYFESAKRYLDEANSEFAIFPRGEFALKFKNNKSDNDIEVVSAVEIDNESVDSQYGMDIF
jgi:superfamily II DNA or RNA helicase